VDAREGVCDGETAVPFACLGAPSPAHEKAIRKLSAEKIEALGEALLDFSASADLARWLRQNK